MVLVFFLIIHVITCISTASGLDADVWRQDIEKRLSLLEEFNVHLQKENANLQFFFSEAQCENKILKCEVKDVQLNV